MANYSVYQETHTIPHNQLQQSIKLTLKFTVPVKQYHSKHYKSTSNAIKNDMCINNIYYICRSTGRDMFVQFKSDQNMVRPGFHAHFDFETQNGSIFDTKSNHKEEFIPLDAEANGAFVGEPGVGKRLQGGIYTIYHILPGDGSCWWNIWGLYQGKNLCPPHFSLTEKSMQPPLPILGHVLYYESFKDNFIYQ